MTPSRAVRGVARHAAERLRRHGRHFPGVRITHELMLRVVVGGLAAGMIAALARRAGSLSQSGQWAAFALGTAATAAGYEWAFLLAAFFLSSTVLTRWGMAEKFARTEAVLPKASERSAIQVFANGGVFVILAALARWSGGALYPLGALGAIAAATADTWSTEVGTLLGGSPRSVLTWRRVSVGMSGGVTPAGSLAGLGGAAVAAAAAMVLAAPADRALTFGAVLAGGVAGNLFDSFVGATLQTRRWCEVCNQWTERRVHICGYRTQHRRGIRWLTNDVTNAMTTAMGAAAAMGVARLSGS